MHQYILFGFMMAVLALSVYTNLMAWRDGLSLSWVSLNSMAVMALLALSVILDRKYRALIFVLTGGSVVLAVLSLVFSFSR